MGRPEMLAAGIGTALMSTAAGLCVAIPALILYLFFVGRVDMLVTEIDRHGQELVNLISAEALEDRRNRPPRTTKVKEGRVARTRQPISEIRSARLKTLQTSDSSADRDRDSLHRFPMPLKTHHDEMPNLNLTSLIDVVFLLIVFFMTASKFTDPARDIDLTLPEVAKGDAAVGRPEGPRRWRSTPTGGSTLDNEAVTLEELTTRLAEAITPAPQQSVVILGDAGCPFQHVAAAMAACKEAGVTELAVSVQVADARRAGARR